MHHYYVALFALSLGGIMPCLAQDLPSTVHTRSHSWYVSASAAAMQPQEFDTNSSIIQNGASAIQSSWGVRLGYSHTPGLALETGVSYLNTSSGFQVQLEQAGISRPYLRNSVYVPASVVLRLWQPGPRLTLRAMLGGAMYLRSPAGFGSFVDTAGYYNGIITAPNKRIFVSKQGNGRQISYKAELGLRAEWQASSKVFIGVETKDMIALNGTENDEITVSDEVRNALAVAHIRSRLQMLSVGINLRYVFQTGTAYRYQGMP